MDSPANAQHPGQPHGPKQEKTDLEMFLRVKGPELLKQHAANILLFLLLIAAATYYFYNRSKSKAVEQMATNQNTALAYSYAATVREAFNSPVVSEQASTMRQRLARDVFSAADLVLNSDASASQKAAALLAKAEVLYQMGVAPKASLATTQTSLGFTQLEPSEYLKQAEDAYTEILGKYTNEKEYVGNALISLAAIAETRSDFAKANEWYQKAIDDKSLRQVYRDIATSRQELLKENSKPFALAAPTTRPTAATTAPSTPGLSFTPSLDSFTTPSTPESTLPAK